PGTTASRLVIRNPDSPSGTMYMSAVAELPSMIRPPTDIMFFGVSSPITRSHLDNKVGLQYPNIEYAQNSSQNPFMELRHGGLVDSGIWLYRELSWMPTNQDLTFFDANSTPETKGDRYVRLSSSLIDYSAHQQLV